MRNRLEKPYYCKECCRGFKCEQVFERHKVTHTSRKSHVCEVCCKTFQCESELKRHMISHTDIRPHACNICRKAYKRKQALERHVKNRCRSSPANTSHTLIWRPVPDLM
ncbi:hypothetical protein CEXT_589911 [Caerostris extrusa]|uniref:C2H2-type domain-containing protein n=1 Tax=Caerostris extrusa TaxID=172846 RepID=A0AAV4Q081_CAEEX|nr:hypothetical protein CEXT_589911 [Caerostris extrusa]